MSRHRYREPHPGWWWLLIVVGSVLAVTAAVVFTYLSR